MSGKFSIIFRKPKIILVDVGNAIIINLSPLFDIGIAVELSKNSSVYAAIVCYAEQMAMTTI